MATEVSSAPRFSMFSMRPEDFETASIHSVAPSYISEAPSYHSTVPPNEPVPAYSPSENDAAHLPPYTRRSSTQQRRQQRQQTQQPSRGPINTRPQGPRVTSQWAASSQGHSLPSPRAFRIPQVAANPTARLYQRVAYRRAAQGLSTSSLDTVRHLLPPARASETEEQRSRVRPLEDPHLVGEQAAAQARSARLAREDGNEVLERENAHWDWYLAQTRDWNVRAASWNVFRRNLATEPHGKLARRLGAR